MKRLNKELNSVKKMLTGSSAKNVIGVSVILSLFLFLHIVNKELRTLALIIVVGGVIHLVTGNEYEAVIGAVLFGIVYNLPSLLRSMSGKYVEGLDDAVDGENKDDEDEDEDVVDLIEKLESDLENAKKHNDAAKADEDQLNKLSDKKELNMNDNERKKMENMSGTKQADLQTPAGAQRETFRLINTVEQLQSTIKELAPTLNSGRKIIEAYEKLSFRKE
jgi:hypothetical protein